MNNELLAMLDFLEQEREIDKETLFILVEEALTASAKKELGDILVNPKVIINRTKGDIVTWADFLVVNQVKDSKREVILGKAQEYDQNAKVGDLVSCKYQTSESLTRIAAQATKQAIMQKFRYLEKERVLEDFSENIGELLSGTVRYFEKGELVVDLGTAEGSLSPQDRISTEDYHNGDHITVILKEVNVKRSGPSLILSRTHPDLVKKLFEREVTEIAEGIVMIKGIAREPGFRTKIAVWSSDNRVDPVGACVGMRGSRVKSIVRELNREKLDIIHWTPDVKNFITEAMKPAEVVSVEIDHAKHLAKVYVTEEQYAVALGKKGHNTKLARQLTGWGIDVVRHKDAEEKSFETRVKEVKEIFQKIPGVTPAIAASLVNNGYLSLDGISASELADITNIEGVDEKLAAQIVSYAREKTIS